MSMMPKNQQLNRFWIIIPCLLLSLGLYEFYISVAKPQVPFMDTMLFFVQIDQLLKGDISWRGIYGSGEHRGLIYPAVTFFEWLFWGVDARITTALTGIVVSATFYYWLSATLNARSTSGIVDRKFDAQVFVVCLAAAAIIVSPAGFELWTLSLGFAQLLKNFLIVTFLYLLAVKRYWDKSVLHAITFGLAGGALILVATYGWSYPFLIACLFSLLCFAFGNADIRARAIIVAVLMLLAQVIYIYSGNGVFSGDKVSSGLSIINLIKGVFFGASTAYIGSEPMATISFPIFIALALGAATLLLAALSLLIALLEQTREKIFLSSLVVFSLMVLAGVAVARGSASFINTGNSRYFVDFVWLLLAPLAIVLTTKKLVVAPPFRYEFIHHLPLGKFVLFTRLLALLLFIAALGGHYVTWHLELKTAPFRTNVFNGMAEVYRWGVNNEQDADLLQSPFPIAKKAIAVAQTYNLAILRSENIKCTLKNAQYSSDWYPAEANNARWMGKVGVIGLGGCASNITIKGYIPENFEQRNLKITYGNKTNVVAIEPGREFQVVLDQVRPGRVIVTMELDQITSPFLSGLGNDKRELGILLTYLGE